MSGWVSPEGGGSGITRDGDHLTVGGLGLHAESVNTSLSKMCGNKW